MSSFQFNGSARPTILGTEGLALGADGVGGTWPSLRSVALLGNHLPRQCGIATFTTDLHEAIERRFPALESFVVAMNDDGSRQAYPSAVRFEIEQDDVASYRRATDALNLSDADVLLVQHEYGIFGGRAGELLLPLLRDVRMPIVTTLHTVLASPDPGQRLVMDEITQVSERLIVMSTQAQALLRRIHNVPADKIDVIAHGIPEAMFTAGSTSRPRAIGHPVILTFGLLSPGKGIEDVVDAMPAILAAFPDSVYVVLGATHPRVLEDAGETYRLMLEARAQRLGIGASVVFHNRFVGQAELAGFLAAADVYITPYRNVEQATSGTLAYALGAGKAIVSTPYRYATEMLADGRGILVPWRDPDAIGRAVIDLLRDPAECQAMRERVAAFARGMSWGDVAGRYIASMERAVAAHGRRRLSVAHRRTLSERPPDLPEVKLDHLRILTDGTGLLQHAWYLVPRYGEGYCLDDNARALMLMTLLEQAGTVERRAARPLISRYLAFVCHAFVPATGRFRNFLSYERTWSETSGSEDSQGRAVWALGTAVGCARDWGRPSPAIEVLRAAAPLLARFSSPRAWAYGLLGINEYLGACPADESLSALRALLTSRLTERFRQASTDDWPWFEDHLTYGNARLPQALIVSGAAMERPDLLDMGLRALEWLARSQRSPEGYFAPVGSNGFHSTGRAHEKFDQQPLEASGMVSACLDAKRVSGDPQWAEHAAAAFGWFLGQNHLQLPVYDAASGGCRDGLHEDRANENQGAESTLSFQLALHDMRAAERAVLAAGS